MLSHRAVVALIAVFSICAAGSLPNRAHAATGTISIHGTTAGVVQNNGTISVLVIRSGGASGAASVLCRTVNGTAVSGSDYTAVNSTLRWADGDAAPKNCTVPISDAIPFSGTKRFYIQLSGAIGATLVSPTRTTVTIYGNKGGGAVSMSAASYTVAQSAGKATITVNRTGGAAGTAVVFYATANKTAIAGSDYTARSGMLTWATAIPRERPSIFRSAMQSRSPAAGHSRWHLLILKT